MDLSEEQSSPAIVRPPSRRPSADRPAPTDTAVSRFLHWAVDGEDDSEEEELFLDDEVTEPTLVLPTFQRWWGAPSPRHSSEG